MNNQINDARLAALHKEGFSGDIDSATLKWLKSAGAGSDDLMDAWSEFFTSELVPEGHHNDRYATWLSSLGYTQKALDDQKHAYWTARLA